MIVVEMADGTIRFFDRSGQELLDEPHALGGPGSGNFNHAGRPGEVGGSASVGTAQSQIAKAVKTLRVITPSQLPAESIDQLEIDPKAEVVVSPTHVKTAEGVGEAVKTLRTSKSSNLRTLGNGIAKHVEICPVAYEPRLAQMTAITGQGRTILLLNTNYDAEAGLKGELGSSIAVTAREADNVLKANGMDAAIRTQGRITAFHEFGHFYDQMTGGVLTDSLLDVVGRAAGLRPGMRDDEAAIKTQKWLAENISTYAATSPHDASAEAFSMLLADKLPPALQDWGTLVKG